ncbi:MAG: GIY-YIG nuclease family protein [Gammaproteobacteria bacterium]|nr:GIY-YIG nuclease family protein [Gammaproteobacteria bacterium]
MGQVVGEKSPEVGVEPGVKCTWFVYIARCCDGSLYTGVTTDVTRRMRQHNAAMGSKYTRARLPLRLVYCESQDCRGKALRREAQIKRLPRKQKLRLIQGSGRETLLP